MKEIKLKVVNSSVYMTINDKIVIINSIKEKHLNKLIGLIFQYNKYNLNNTLNKIQAIIYKYENKKIKNKKIKNTDIISEKYYLKNYNIEIPNIFIKHLTNELPNSYSNFLKLLSLNPIKEIRERLPEYVIKNNLRISTNGYIVGCRQVWLDDNFTLNDKIQSLYFKVKTVWKKSASKVLLDVNYNITTKDGVLTLQEAYDSMSNEKNTYRSNYNKHHGNKTSEKWKIGDVIEINDRSFYKTNEDCSSDMYHIRSNPKELKDYGDTNIIVLINPQDVISCVSEWKFGVCKFYFASLLEDSDNLFKKPMQEFEHHYMEEEFKTISDQLMKKKIVNYKNEDLKSFVNENDYYNIIVERIKKIV